MEEIKVSAGLEEKKKLAEELAEKMKASKTVLIVSTKGLPSSQFQLIKKSLRGTAEIRIAKKSVVIRAIGKVEKGSLQNLKEFVGADVALFFSDLDAFELSGMLSDNQSPAKAKAGNIAPEDIKVEEGPTELIPGPAISELGAVGLKVAVENGKLAIKQARVIVKSGEEIDDKVASVLGKLNILPMKVGFIPVAAYDSVSDQVYKEIKIDKEEALDELQAGISKALGFAVDLGYITGETVGYFIAKAGVEEKALEKLIGAGEKSESGIGEAEAEKSGAEVEDGGEKKGEETKSEEGDKVEESVEEKKEEGDNQEKAQ